jgi:Flp pilus assembly protein TadD
MLLQVAERLHKLSADDVMAANNFAQLSMLQGRNLERAHRLAEANHQRFPSNSVFRSTHAFALYQQGRLAEALQVMEGIPEQNLKHTGMSAYYGLLLAANGRTNEALPHLAGALTTDHLLPTERKLVAEARQRIQ